MKGSGPASRTKRRVAVLDAGPLEAIANPGDPAHAWATGVFSDLRRAGVHLVTFEAALCEAVHGVGNHPSALGVLRRLCNHLEVLPVAAERVTDVLDECTRWAPRMDFADACAVVTATAHRRSFVVTLDFRDFSTYRVPFCSPEGNFYFE